MEQEPETIRPTARLDYLLLASVVALLVIGTLMVYSSSFVVAHNEFNDDLYFLTRQVSWVSLGAIALVIGARVPYWYWSKLSLLVLAGSLALLVLVLLPGVGSSSYGAVRWIKLGPFLQVQPSEVAKLALVLYLADWLARRGSHVQRFANGMVPFVIIVVLVAGLVELQPDLGTASVIVGTAAIIFFVAGANLLQVGMLGGLGLLGIIAMIPRLSGYRQDRIAAFLDPWSDIQGTGWHTAQTLIALGSGGLWGLGLGASRQKFYWIPNAHTDAIFAIIGEELGFLGTVAVLALFACFAYRGYLIAWRAPDSFGRLLAVGLTSLVVVQATINIAVVTNTIPFTGVTLPFISFGGSSTMVSMFAVGVLLSISRQRGPAPSLASAVREALGRQPARTAGAESEEREPARSLSGPRPSARAARGAALQTLGVGLRSGGGLQAHPVRRRARRAARASSRGAADG